VHEFGYMLTKFGSGNYKRKVSERVERNGVAFVFEPTASNNFLIGSSRSFVGEDISNDIEVMQALAERAIRFFPVIRDIKVIRGYSGLVPSRRIICPSSPTRRFPASTSRPATRATASAFLLSRARVSQI
jgi:hypothetical protein